MLRLAKKNPIEPFLRLFVLALAATTIAAPASAQFWNPFRSKPKAEQPAARPAPAQPATPTSLELTDLSGPWLIVATTFSGAGSEQQATELCLELRKQYGLTAYIHEQTFNLGDDEPVGRGIDERGRPIRMRYRAGDKRTEWAVLVGDYPTIDDTVAQSDLKKLRSAEPAALAIDEAGRTNQNLANTRKLMTYFAGRKETGGPMRSAFLTRNPLLPEEFFKPKGVDPFVAKMNKGFDHSGLDIKGKYTVKVASFSGRGTLVGATTAKRRSGAKKEVDPLTEAAENAHLLCDAMRDKGWEAYEFHDRDESCVLVGSFDEVVSAGQPRAEVMEIIRTFGAAFDTPAAPLNQQSEANQAGSAKRQVLQQVGQLGGANAARLATGMKPKYANIEVRKNQPWRAIPFDIHPEVIEAPKPSVSGSLAWRR